MKANAMDDVQELLTDVHHGLALPEDHASLSTSCIVTGSYKYYHYGCDKFDDRGWGCGYRTLQTLCSWIRLQKLKDKNEKNVNKVPSLPVIQQGLVAMGDKPDTFIGSRNWIGSFEVCITIDHLYDVPCKIMHINSGRELQSKIPALMEHFQQFGSPVMMGGDTDSSSKGILGVCTGTKSYLLVLDPHFWGTPTNSILHEDKWLSWKPVDDFLEDSFYNFCLPQLKAR
ncbi:ufm1-specific protease 1-like [Amphiura filiformis]|uniref:ufm1-specific protease 1-like n=1 Tax=Amphiura filiformis TaxID=82378 RepID=UPI003B220B55